MIRIIGAVLVLGATSGLGFSMAMNLKKRMELLQHIKKMLFLLRGEIRYARAPLFEAFGNMSKVLEEPYSSFCRLLSDKLTSLDGSLFQTIWKDLVNQTFDSTELTKEDKEQLLHLGDQMGYLDEEQQLGNIDLYLGQLELQLEDARNNLGQKTKLYHCLGVMGGIFLIILIY